MCNKPNWRVPPSTRFDCLRDQHHGTKNILISGCSGGGKSTLLRALSQIGYSTIPEPGRRIVTEEMRADGGALPWVDLHAFARRAVELAQSDLSRAKDMDGPVFFDRGLIDAAVALEHAGGPSYRALLGSERHYARRVFLAPPWPEIFVTDQERRNSFEDATAEYRRLQIAFDELGYEAVELPKAPVTDRIDIVLNTLDAG
ncbi:MAG: AAA family ATPase [Pseudomonadota bacterium]